MDEGIKRTKRSKHVTVYLNYFDLSDGEEWMCEYCGKSYRINNGLEIHHIRQRNKLFDNSIDNLICLCTECHYKVHNKGMNITIEHSRINRK